MSTKSTKAATKAVTKAEEAAPSVDPKVAAAQARSLQDAQVAHAARLRLQRLALREPAARELIAEVESLRLALDKSQARVAELEAALAAASNPTPPSSPQE